MHILLNITLTKIFRQSSKKWRFQFIFSGFSSTIKKRSHIDKCFMNMLSWKKPQPTQRWIGYIVLKIWTVNNSTEGKIKLFRTKYNDANMIFFNFYKNSTWLCCQMEFPFGVFSFFLQSATTPRICTNFICSTNWQ